MHPILPSTVDAPVVYYALGGGMGHVTRASAIIRQLRRYGLSQTVVLTNTQYPHPLHHEGILHWHITGQTQEAVSTQVQQHIEDLSPSVLLVDVFADGIIGDLERLLPDLPCPKVLITRYVREAYRQRQATSAAYYNVILATEETALQHPHCIPCDPILFRSADELFPRVRARQCLGIEDDAPGVLVVSTGSVEWERDFLGLIEKVWQRKRPRAHLRVASPRELATPFQVTHYPLFELMPGVDIIIGAGGYNLFHEVCASGVTGIFLPQLRRIDDQDWRTQGSMVARSPEDLEICLEQALDTVARTSRCVPCFPNGAETVAREIVALLELPFSCGRFVH